MLSKQITPDKGVDQTIFTALELGNIETFLQQLS